MRNRTEGIDYSDLHWGKYDCPMAQYIDLRVMTNGDFGDEEESDGDGTGMARYGRRVFWWDNRGFVGCDTFGTVDDAVEAFARVRDNYYYATCETCGEKVHSDHDSWYEHERWECEPKETKNPYAGPGGLLDEIRQAEQQLGTE